MKDGEMIRINEMKPCAVASSRIEEMRSSVKVHRAAIDFDTAFCEATMRLKKE